MFTLMVRRGDFHYEKPRNLLAEAPYMTPGLVISMHSLVSRILVQCAVSSSLDVVSSFLDVVSSSLVCGFQLPGSPFSIPRFPPCCYF
jgi:hypothetical protein